MESKQDKTATPAWKWDKWQQEVLDYDGNITIRAGRQVGKSEVISEKACRFALKNPNTTTLILAASQRQSSLLFEKVRGNLVTMQEDTKKIILAETPTATKIILKNGSKIYSLPAGRTAYSIRGYTLDLLIIDEASFVPELVYNAVIPMIAVSRQTRNFGHMILISTPFGKGGYFYHSFSNDEFKSWHISSEDCPRIPKTLLKKEKDRLSKAEYRQEWQGEFTDEWNQFFSTELIRKQMTFIDWEKRDDRRYYLGVDIARYGGDENAFVICELDDRTSYIGNNHKKLKIVKCITTARVSTTDTIARIEILEQEYRFKKIFIDDAGIGGAVTDILLQKLGRKVMGLNNSSKRVEMQGEEKKKGILKEDLYSNALMLLETGMLELISDMQLLKSMKSITYEYTDNRQIKIFGTYSHLTEALVRACWCLKERGLDLYVY